LYLPLLPPKSRLGFFGGFLAICRLFKKPAGFLVICRLFKKPAGFSINLL
jgi:hypothetical protein